MNGKSLSVLGNPGASADEQTAWVLAECEKKMGPYEEWLDVRC